MSSSTSRASLLKKAHKVLKKHYKPVTPPERTLLEHVIYGACLEDAKFEAADEAFARLQQSFFDWNEVRVTTVRELSEVTDNLPNPAVAATRLRTCLNAIFETYYEFDIEFMKKQNLGKAVDTLHKLNGFTPFVVAYVTQAGLSGHAIPVAAGSLSALEVMGAVSPAEAARGKVPGMERAIPKNKGVEFGSMLHQLGVEYGATPFSNRVRAIILEIAPDAKERFPKRGVKKEADSTRKKAARKTAPRKTATAAKSSSARKAAPAKKKKTASKRITRKKPR